MQPPPPTSPTSAPRTNAQLVPSMRPHHVLLRQLLRHLPRQRIVHPPRHVDLGRLSRCMGAWVGVDPQGAGQAQDTRHTLTHPRTCASSSSSRALASGPFSCSRRSISMSARSASRWEATEMYSPGIGMAWGLAWQSGVSWGGRRSRAPACPRKTRARTPPAIPPPHPPTCCHAARARHQARHPRQHQHVLVGGGGAHAHQQASGGHKAIVGA